MSWKAWSARKGTEARPTADSTGDADVSSGESVAGSDGSSAAIDSVLMGPFVSVQGGRGAHDDALRSRVGEAPDHDRADVAGGGVEAVQRPAAVLARRVVHAQQPRGLPGGERDVEALERVGEARAERLDIGLLAGPAVEEAERAVLRGERAVGLLLDGREETGRDVVRVRQLAHRLDVHPDLAASREGMDGHVAAVRDVEAQAGTGVAGRQRGLAA